MRPGQTASLLVALAFAIGAASCDVPPPPPSPSPPPTVAAAPSSVDPTPVAGSDDGPEIRDTAWLPPWAGPGTPPAIAERAGRRFCGVERGPRPANPAVRNCFEESVAAGLDVEFARIETTVEGDPIASIYGFEPPNGFVFLVDSTQDAFGSGAWTVADCQRMIPDALTVFTFDGCADGRVVH